MHGLYLLIIMHYIRFSYPTTNLKEVHAKRKKFILMLNTVK